LSREKKTKNQSGGKKRRGLLGERGEESKETMNGKMNFGRGPEGKFMSTVRENIGKLGGRINYTGGEELTQGEQEKNKAN